MRSFIKVLKFDTLQDNLSSLPDLIKQSDCITLHIPMNKDNENFMSKERLSLMKNNAVLINTARGAIVDENALYNEIKSQRLRCAFDVFWKEPYNGKLKAYHPEFFFMSPHIASTCDEFLIGCRKGLDNLIKELRK